MLKQVLQQNPSKSQAKSKQSQRQIVARRLFGFGMKVETSIHSFSYVMAGPRVGWMGADQ